MNKRQRKKAEKVLWEKLKYLGGSRKDIYVRMTCDYYSPRATYDFRKGDLLKLQTRSDGTILDVGYKSVQCAVAYGSELFHRNKLGDEWYDNNEVHDGALAGNGEYKIVWKDGKPV